MAVNKKSEPSNKKFSKSGLKIFLFIALVGIIGFFMGVHRDQVQEVYEKNSPAVVEGVKTGYAGTKQGLSWIIPRVNNFFDNMGKNMNAFIDRVTTTQPVPADRKK